ncbi:nucleotide-binding alpha-beta plait domain-containing protein [Artemisia annua]|uniref:Nucleotide-binding alpha-beta plait domain-containing protein n=1 Tax=Artemisia annua TaxID=35608 RepID=A0A2U1L5N1_ARTAN|nr:nucleotide-binding alpha-beta plait domain-containing protein [Artemisia annua]
MQKLEEWQEVVKGRRRQYEGRTSGNGEHRITKFFISNLPKGCTPWDVKYVLGGFGEVASAYIARKYDKFGCRFFFISFRAVKDVRSLELRLNGVKMGHNKLRVNVAKFATENVEIENLGEKKGEVKKGKEAYKSNGHFEETEKARSNYRGGYSYKDTLVNKESRDNNNVESMEAVYSSKVVVIPEATQAFKELHGRALVGRVESLEKLITLDKLMVEAGIGEMVITYIGGLSVLLKFKSDEKAYNFLTDKDVWCRWFSMLDRWNGQVLSFERIAWVKIQGVPLNLAENSVFDKVAACFGKVVHKAHMCPDDCNLSSTIVGILVGEGVRICDSVVVKWKNRQFKVWVEEGSGTWDPDCVGAVEVPSFNTCRKSNEDEDNGGGERRSGGSELPINVEVEETILHGNLHEHGANNNDGGNIDTDGVGHGAFQFNSSNMGDIENNHHKRRRYKPKPNSVSKKVSPNNYGPRKRPRVENDDPFDLDRFIGIINDGNLWDKGLETQNQEGNTSAGGESLDKGTGPSCAEFDLNNMAEVEVPVENDDGSDEGIIGQESMEGVEGVAKEVEATISVGIAVGVDLSGCEVVVKKSIEDEGNNGVKG